MEKTNKDKIGWKRRIAEEFIEYLFNVAYLFLFFGAFTWCKRLILAQHGIDYLDYGTSLIEALILGKVVMIGKIMGLGNLLDSRPLIITILYKSAVFAIFIFIFTLLEHAVKGWWSDIGALAGIKEFLTKDKSELLAQSLVVFAAFIPFFAFKETERVMGKGSLSRLFFQKKYPQ